MGCSHLLRMDSKLLVAKICQLLELDLCLQSPKLKCKLAETRNDVLENFPLLLIQRLLD
jgi:hypothetical protein